MNCWYTQQFAWLSRTLCWVKKANLKKSKLHASIYITFLNYEIIIMENRFVIPEEGRTYEYRLSWGGTYEYKGVAERDLCGEGIFLCSLQRWLHWSTYVSKWHRTMHIHCTRIRFFILLLYYSYVSCSH